MSSKTPRRRAVQSLRTAISVPASSSQRKTPKLSSTSILAADSIVSVVRAPYRLEFSLPGLPKSTNGFRKTSHWDRLKHDKGWKKDLATIITDSKLPPKPLSRFRITGIRFSSQEPDYDGLVSSFKVIVDGLRELRVIQEDKLSNTGPWTCLWFHADPKAGFIRVCIQEVPVNAYEGL